MTSWRSPRPSPLGSRWPRLPGTESVVGLSRSRCATRTPSSETGRPWWPSPRSRGPRAATGRYPGSRPRRAPAGGHGVTPSAPAVRGHTHLPPLHTHLPPLLPLLHTPPSPLLHTSRRTWRYSLSASGACVNIYKYVRSLAGLHRTQVLRDTRTKGPLQSTRIPSPPLRLIRHTTADNALTDALTGHCCLSVVFKCRCAAALDQP
ncbi:hypothetical protein T492DRAFT_232571 [Pavlovales sp. CCMP2436]|nr:hypothetical protein T492DRAFT_232571 [Pavlovales sp. CCMP2436]